MKKTILILLFVGMFSAAYPQAKESFAVQSAKNLSDLPIKDIVKGRFGENLAIGIANQWRLNESLSGEIARREFDYITPTNDFKQSYVHPDFDTWRWAFPDNWIKYAAANNIRLRMHGPISPQCSRWAMDDSRTPAELSRMMEEYMTQLCIHYGNCPEIGWMDVVNETIVAEKQFDSLNGMLHQGDWFGPRAGDSVWQNPWTIIGFDENSALHVPLYIDKAFEIADKYAPKLKKIINQDGRFEEKVWEKMKQLVVYLRGKGHTVDGLGWQAHIETGWELVPGNLERLDNFITWCHKNRLEFHITEMNVWIKDGDVSKEKQQADTYGAIFSTLLKHTREGKVRVNFWSVRDVDNYEPEWMGCLWRNDGSPRPAYDRIKKELIDFRP